MSNSWTHTHILIIPRLGLLLLVLALSPADNHGLSTRCRRPFEGIGILHCLSQSQPSRSIQRFDDYHFDEMLCVVMSEQEAHLSRIRQGSRACPRARGTVKFLDDILADVGDFMHGVMRRNEQKIQPGRRPGPHRRAAPPSSSASLPFWCRTCRGSACTATSSAWERMTSLEGDTGARTCRTLEPTTIMTYLFRLTHRAELEL
ncbi:hypothetical protein B0T17DRAFT_542766 [Bombardia bombarda]|uniref:Uncharacterized protein n=1 Tax=Bombardia bombarda TaxID=252184 RepID=A0AA39U6U0_9PEZI|nr:hypothetical protein B0T17DRAFT_542766 [Bombardia bombarda]